MAKHNKNYGQLKDGLALTDESARALVESAFLDLAQGKGKLIKAPQGQLRIKVSVHQLPQELQEAALFR